MLSRYFFENARLSSAISLDGYDCLVRTERDAICIDIEEGNRWIDYHCLQTANEIHIVEYWFWNQPLNQRNQSFFGYFCPPVVLDCVSMMLYAFSMMILLMRLDWNSTKFINITILIKIFYPMNPNLHNSKMLFVWIKSIVLIISWFFANLSCFLLDSCCIRYIKAIWSLIIPSMSETKIVNSRGKYPCLRITVFSLRQGVRHGEIKVDFDCFCLSLGLM